jgi:hypothetical protein
MHEQSTPRIVRSRTYVDTACLKMLAGTGTLAEWGFSTDSLDAENDDGGTIRILSKGHILDLRRYWGLRYCWSPNVENLGNIQR